MSAQSTAAAYASACASLYRARRRANTPVYSHFGDVGDRRKRLYDAVARAEEHCARLSKALEAAP